MTTIFTENPKLATTAAELLKALGHPLRLRIIALLANKEASVNELVEQLDVKQPIVSQQLRILRLSGLVESRREGGYSAYFLMKPHLKNMLSCIEGCLDSRGGEL
ncbi:MAG: winged helix-turn-helix transcriptional regulator [Proteobacteria bacterium]|jgi:DNA-binding transcriptional ArsR family regulator|nr:winged helix-turn-helix transcriptional regulator [Pseudomonadota bacterium]